MSQNKLEPCPFCGGDVAFERAFMAEPTVESFKPRETRELKIFLSQAFHIKCKSCGFETRDFSVRLEIDRANLSLKGCFEEEVAHVRNRWNRRADNGKS